MDRAPWIAWGILFTQKARWRVPPGAGRPSRAWREGFTVTHWISKPVFTCSRRLNKELQTQNWPGIVGFLGKLHCSLFNQSQILESAEVGSHWSSPERINIFSLESQGGSGVILAAEDFGSFGGAVPGHRGWEGSGRAPADPAPSGHELSFYLRLTKPQLSAFFLSPWPWIGDFLGMLVLRSQLPPQALSVSLSWQRTLGISVSPDSIARSFPNPVDPQLPGRPQANSCGFLAWIQASKFFHRLRKGQGTVPSLFCQHGVVPAPRGTWNTAGVSTFKETPGGTVTAKDRQRVSASSGDPSTVFVKRTPFVNRETQSTLYHNQRARFPSPASQEKKPPSLHPFPLPFLVPSFLPSLLSSSPFSFLLCLFPSLFPSFSPSFSLPSFLFPS